MHGWSEQKGWDYAFNELDAIPYSVTRGYEASVLKDRDRYVCFIRIRCVKDPGSACKGIRLKR